MNKEKSVKLDKEILNEIKKLSSEKKFSLDSTLFYEGQVPIVAYLILDGQVKLMKQKKVKNVLKAGSLIGLNEMMSNTPSKFGAVVLAQSTLCYLDKSTIKEILTENESLLSPYLATEAQ